MVPMGPLVVEERRGTPIAVFGRTLTPVTRMASRLRHQATVRAARVEASGGGMASARPVAVIEERNGEVRRLPIRDATASVLRRLAMAAVIVPIAGLALIFASRWSSKR